MSAVVVRMWRVVVDRFISNGQQLGLKGSTADDGTVHQRLTVTVQMTNSRVFPRETGKTFVLATRWTDRSKRRLHCRQTATTEYSPT